MTNRRGPGGDPPSTGGSRWDQPRSLASAGVERRPPSRPPSRGVGRSLLLLIGTGAAAAAVVLAVITFQPERRETPGRPPVTTVATAPDASPRAPVTGDDSAVLRELDRRILVNRRIDQTTFVVNWAVIASVVLLIGMAVFLLVVYPAGRSERSPLDGHGRLRGLAKLAAFIVVVGCVAEVLLRAAMASDRGWSGATNTHSLLFVLAGPVGVSCLLRGAGALLILAMMLGRFSPVKRPFTIARGGVSLIGGVHVSALASRRLATALGIVVSLASFPVVGHAQASSPRILLMVADVTHVLAAAVWFGGVVMLSVMLRQLRRVTKASSPLEPDPDLQRLRRQMAVAVGRFSLAAMASIASVTVAGLALAVSQITSTEALYRTAYGLTLVAKLTMVGFVMLIGGYNHRFVVRRVLDDESDEKAWRTLRRTVQVEALVIFGGVLVASVALAYGGFANVVR